MVIRTSVEVTVLLTWLRKELRKHMEADVPNEILFLSLSQADVKNSTNSTVHFVREQTVRKWREVYI